MSCLVSMALGAQVSTYFGGTLNVFSAMGSGPEYTVVGFFNDTSGEYPLDSVEVGDIIYVSEGVTCARLRVDTINSSAGGILDADVYDIDTVLLSPPSGISALLKETPNASLPRYIPGLSENLLACIRTHMTGKIDQEIAGAGDGNGLISDLPDDRVEIESDNSLLIETDSFKIDATMLILNVDKPNNFGFKGNENGISIGDYDDEAPNATLNISNIDPGFSLGNTNPFHSFAPLIIGSSTGLRISSAGDVINWVDIDLSSHLITIGDTEGNSNEYKLVLNNDEGSTSLGSENGNVVFLDQDGFHFDDLGNGYINIIRYDINDGTITLGDIEEGNSGSSLSLSFEDSSFSFGDINGISSGVGLVHNEGESIIKLGELTNYNSGEKLTIDYTSGITSLGDSEGITTGMQLHLNNSNQGVITLGDKDDVINGTKIVINNSTESVAFSSDSYTYTFPTTAPGANQVLSEGPTDDNQLVWVDPASGADGNGIISALPSAPVTIDANNNAFVIDSTSTTRIGAVNSAQGDLVVSGSSSLPSSLSHIDGADTSQINIRGSVGITLSTDQNIVFEMDTASYTFPTGGPAAYQILWEGASDDNVLEWGDLPGNMYVIDGAITSGEARYVLSDPVIDGTTWFIGYADPDESAMGDPWSGWNIGIGIEAWGPYLQNGVGSEVGKVYVSSDNAAPRMEYGTGEEDFDRLELWNGDLRYFNETDLIMTVGAGATEIYTTTGVAFREYDNPTGWYYKFPVSSPATTQDSIDRVINWQRTSALATAAFELNNGATFRTHSATGNVLPYDDIIECVPDVDAHLPAPSAKYVGKIYTIYVGGAGAGSGITIDVVDGSSSIELGPSLTMTTAWETYVLVCNGSQWIIVSHKP